MNIAIHGCGYVGGTHCNYFETVDGVTLLKYDPGKGFFDDISVADLHFIAVPTPFNEEEGGYSNKHIFEAIDFITEKQPNGAFIIIKSTVYPGTTRMLQERYPQHTFIFSPEFLKKRTADEDFRNPDRHIIGFVNDQGKNRAREVLDLLPKAKQEHLMQATEAELVKYFSNTFLANKVVFANMIYDLCEKLGVDYEKVREGVASDPRIGTTHLDIFQDGERGYGGICFPKDIRSLIQLGDELGVDVTLLKETERRNNELKKK